MFHPLNTEIFFSPPMFIYWHRGEYLFLDTIRLTDNISIKCYQIWVGNIEETTTTFLFFSPVISWIFKACSPKNNSMDKEERFLN